MKTKISILFLFISTLIYSNDKIGFLENKGQWSKNVNYKACTRDGSIFLEKDKMTFVYFSLEDVIGLQHSDLDIHEHKQHSGDHSSCGHMHLDDEHTNIRYHAYQVNFINCNKDVFLNGEDKRQEYYNFFIGSDQEKWAGDVNAYNKIKYSNLYKDIELVTYSVGGKFKYDFIINPGADISSIQLDYDGVESIEIKENNLIISTSVKEIIELAPFAYQFINGRKVKVECYYSLNNNILSFELPNGYDNTKQLIIDPTIEGCTFAGTAAGMSTDTWGSTASFDSDGNIYIGARSFSAGYPLTTGAYQTSSQGASMSFQITTVGISKYSPDATTLLYSTYLGGSGTDTPHSLFVNNNGELYIYGSTNSINFPCSASAFDNSNNGQEDIFITHFNATGTNIIGSTYIGGSGIDGVGDNWITTNYGDEYRGEIIVDNSGNCYVSSITQSTNFPANAYQTTFGGTNDGVIFSLNSNLSALNWSTYFGGTGYDVAYGIRLDASNNIYVCGAAGNNFFTGNGYRTLFIGGSNDGYLVKFSPDASNLLNATYFGTSDKDEAFFVDINPDGDVYIYGQNDGNLTPTPGIYSNPGSKQFIAKFTPDLVNLIYQTVIGSGTSWDYDFAPSAFMVDVCDRVYIAGHSSVHGYLSGCPVTHTTGGFSSSGGIYLAALEPAGTGLMFGTYIKGADHVDGGTSRFDPNGVVYHGVCSCSFYSPDFPTTLGAYDNSNSTANCDMGVFKINFDVSFVLSSFQTDTIDSLCAPATINFTNNSQNAVQYIWEFDDGTVSTAVNPTHTYNTAGTYEVMLIAIDSSSCNISDSTKLSIFIYNCGATANDTTVCYGDTTEIYASGIGIQTYNWSHGLPPTAGPHQVAPLVTTDYYITVTDTIGNVFVDTATVTVIPLPVVDLGPDTSLCAGTVYPLNAGNPGSTYLWQDGSVNQTLIPSTTGIYSVTVISAAGCIKVDSVYVEFGIFNQSSSVTEVSCYNGNDGAIDLTTSGMDPMTYLWSNGSISQDISGLIAGIYTVTVTDSVNCVFIIDIQVSQPQEILITTIDTNVSCYQFADGSIHLAINGGTGPYTFLWSTGATTQNIDNLDVNSYSVIVTDSHMCTATASTSITEPLPLSSEIMATHNLCYGDQNGTANLNVTGGTPPYSYLWNTGSTNQDLVHLLTGAYSVTITDFNGCVIADNTFINGIDSPIVTVHNITELLCYGDSDAAIQTSVSGGTPPYTYLWNTGSISNGIEDIPAGTYTLTITDNNNCEHIENVIIENPDKVYIELPENFYMCQNPEETITASVTGGSFPYSFEWNTGHQSQSIVVAPTEETDYYITVTDVNGCTATNDITVFIYPPLQIEALANHDTVCPGEPVLLSAAYLGGSGTPYVFYVDSQMTSLPLTVYPANGQTYTIAVVDQCNSLAVDFYTLYNYPMPPVGFNSNIVNGCEPLEVWFNEHGGCENCSYVWNFDDINHINISTDHNPVYIFEESGVYDVSCQVTNEYGCTNIHTIANMITVYPVPDANFMADPEIASIIKPLINFYNQTEGAVDYYWSFGDGDSSDHVNPYHWYPQSGSYIVELIAVSEYNCADTVYITVKINDEFTFFAPTAFSPDFDGSNDIFYVFGNGIDNTNFELIVYDRWGEPIFKSNDIYKGWDGRAKGNALVKTGAYTWVCIYKDMNHVEHKEVGSVTVIR